MIKILKENNISNMPLISVVIPIYNVELYLKECIESICKQSLRDIEIICIDDGSTDKSLKVALDMADADTRITVVSKTNSGVSDTRNCGIDIAKGKYIYFCDSDDFLSEVALQECYNIAEQNNLDLVMFSAEPFTDSDECVDVLNKYQKYYSRTHTYPGVFKGIALFSSLMDNNEYLMSPVLYIVKKSHLEKYNHRFIPRIIHEDNAFTFEVLISAESVVFINKSFYQRRIHGNSIMTTKASMANVLGYFKCYLHMVYFINKFKFDKQYEDKIVLRLSLTLNSARRYYKNLLYEERTINEFEDFAFKVNFNNFIVEWCAEAEKYEKIKFQLQKEVNTLQKENNTLQKEKKNILSEFDNMKRLHLSQIKSLSNELNNVKNGLSFKIGRVITYIPRTIIGRR